MQFGAVYGNVIPLLGRHAEENMKLITVNYNCFKLFHEVTTTNMLDVYADVWN